MRTRLIAMALLAMCSRAVQSQPRTPAAEGSNLTQEATARAYAVLEAALQAHGGIQALQGIATTRRELQGNRTDVGQGPAPVPFLRVADRVGTIPRTVNPSRSVVYRDLKQQRSADHITYEIFGGQHVSRRLSIGASDGFIVYYDYIYRGGRRLQPAALARSRAAQFRRDPESLLLNAWTRREQARWLGATRWEGRPQSVIALADVDGTQLSLVFDDATKRLTKVETPGEDGVLGDIITEVAYDDYRNVGGVMLPFHYIDRRGGVVLDDIRALSIDLNVPLPDSLFEWPQGLPEIDLGKPFPVYETLGDGVHAVLGGYNSIFVVMNDYVIVLEAGGSSREAETVIQRIHEVAPGKPIRYVVVTHWNYDHVSGIRPYVAEGATFVAPPSARPIIEAAARARRPLHPDALSRTPAQPKFEDLGGPSRTFTDGTRTVVVHDISPSPHAEGMFVAYLPAQGILFEGDLLDVLVPGHAGSAGDDTRHLAEQIRKLGLNVQKIVPVHGQAGTMEDLRQSLERRP